MMKSLNNPPLTRGRSGGVVKEGTDSGFTLVEVIFAIAIGLILLAAIYVAIQSGQRSSGAIEAKTAAQQDVRAALEVMSLEIGMASYRLPAFASTIWNNSPACGTGVASRKGIQEATAFSITVEMDINDDGVIAGGSNEVIRYAYLGGAANQRITRETNCGGGQPFLGDIPNDPTRPRAVRVINDKNGNGTYDDGVDIPVFRYWDGVDNVNPIPYTKLSSPGDGTRIKDIRRIDIILAVETEDRDPNTNQRRSLVYSTSVIPRNHAMTF